jgi:hypothetical protein
MKRIIYIGFLIIVIGQFTKALVNTMWAAPTGNGSTINSPCGVTLLYPGGTGNFENGSNVFITFCVPAGEYLVFNFSMFNVHQGYDFFGFYNGPSTASPLIVSQTGTNIPAPIYSSQEGCITILYYS